MAHLRRRGSRPSDASTLSPEGGWGSGDQVQVLIDDLSNEELMRMWDAVDPSYRLSLPLVARVVRIDVEQPLPLPVVGARFGMESFS